MNIQKTYINMGLKLEKGEMRSSEISRIRKSILGVSFGMEG